MSSSRCSGLAAPPFLLSPPRARAASAADRLAFWLTSLIVCATVRFLTSPGAFTDLLEALIEPELGIVTELSTTRGTSDARIIKHVCPVV